MMPDEARRRAERRQGPLALFIRAKHADEDPGPAQIGRDIDPGHAEKADPGILDFPPNNVVDFLPQELTDLLRSPTHASFNPHPTEKSDAAARNLGRRDWGVGQGDSSRLPRSRAGQRAGAALD